VQEGAATLVAGTVTVAANVTAGSVIHPSTDKPDLVNVGNHTIANRVNGAPGSFDIVSDNGADTSGVRWLVIG
jgi:hypothetical protein